MTEPSTPADQTDAPVIVELDPREFVTRPEGRRARVREGRRALQAQREREARPISKERTDRLFEACRRLEEELDCHPHAELPLLDLDGFGQIVGGSLPVGIWRDFMTAARTGTPVRPLPTPGVSRLRAKSVHAAHTRRGDGSSARVGNPVFRPGRSIGWFCCREVGVA